MPPLCGKEDWEVTVDLARALPPGHRVERATAGDPDRRLGPSDRSAEVDRLRSQNEKMRQAMRHCIDCEYRVEVMATRAEEGRSAAGGDPT